MRFASASERVPVKRRLALDGLRGVAILLVVAYHGGRMLPGGCVGVDVFFVLSGYLITTLLLGEIERNGRVDLRSFYRRRAARLIPALAVCLPTGLALYYLFDHPEFGAAARGAGAAFSYTTDFAVGVVGPLAVAPFVFAWSLAIEEQFYVVWPAVLQLALRRTTRRRLAVCLLLLAIVVMVARALASDWAVGYFQPEYRADGLLVGSALALLPPLQPRKIVLFGGAGLVAFGALIPPTVSLSQTIAHSAATVGAAGLLICADDSPLLATPGIGHLGRISYSLYLWNSFLAGFLLPRIHTALAIPIWLGLSLALSHLSTVYLEEPARRFLGNARGSRASADHLTVARPGVPSDQLAFQGSQI